ncbi:restriction endonuclease subunit S [Streptomyces virginiae]|uniref:restriction endonuclease subunit S n=1 Tax=Streptomyces virginiae TaxID=1961 RepID=UPI0033B9AAE7
MASGGTQSMPTRPLSTAVASVASGKTARRDTNGRYPLYGSTGQIGRTNQVEFTGPSILVARVGANAGSVYRVDGHYGVTDNTLVIRPEPGQSVEFLDEFLRHANLNQMVYGSGQPLVTGTMLKRLQIPNLLPESQRRIASALREANDLISALERMIAKKRAIKRGMLQQLLTGKTTLRGSSASGGDAVLGSITTWFSGGTPDRNNPTYWGGTIPWISAATLKRSRVHDSDQHLTEAGVRAGSKLAPAGATLVLVRGMALHREARIGMATRPVSFNQDVKALIPKPGVLPEYLVYALQARSTQVLDLVSSAGSGTGVLDTQLLQRLPIWVPDETTQRKIIAAIEAVDRNVEALDRLLVKRRATKQGMTQQLMTGRSHLLVKEDVA